MFIYLGYCDSTFVMQLTILILVTWKEDGGGGRVKKEHYIYFKLILFSLKNKIYQKNVIQVQLYSN